MNDKELEIFREQMEKEFFRLLESGSDIRHFLYLPAKFYTEKIKHELDVFLMEEAYQKIEDGSLSPEIFVVYKDSLITVKFDKTEKQVELLEKLLEFYTKREKYENCSKIFTLLNKIR